MERGLTAGLISFGAALLLTTLPIVGASEWRENEDAAPRMSGLKVVPGSPKLADAPHVSINVEGSAEVLVATFFMCIVAPKSLCYLAEEMTRSGSSFTFTTRPLKEYPETLASMDIGLSST